MTIRPSTPCRAGSVRARTALLALLVAVLVPGVTASAAAFPGGSLGDPASRGGASQGTLPVATAGLRGAGIPPLDSRTSLLVVSPHPDDETLCCAGVIQRVVSAGGRASIVWLTSGDGSELDLLFIEKAIRVQPKKMRDLAVQRMREARAAAAILGVPPGRQFFLGYPDGGLLSLITDHFTVPYYSKFTGAASVPYRDTLGAGHPYTGESLERDFARVLDRVRPTLVLAPSPQDRHPDHRAAGILTLQVLSRRHELPVARFWIVHGGVAWPSPRGLRMNLPLPVPPRGRGLPLAVFPVDRLEEAHQLEAVRQYRTQMRVMSLFLLSFVRTNELFSTLPVPPPLGGALAARAAHDTIPH